MYTVPYTFYTIEEKEPLDYVNVLVETTDGDFMVVYYHDGDFHYINGQPFGYEVYSWADI